MATKIIQHGSTTFTMTCHECGTYFTYEREDLHPNFMKGGEWVSCPLCRQSCRHMGQWGKSTRRGGSCGEMRCVR